MSVALLESMLRAHGWPRVPPWIQNVRHHPLPALMKPQHLAEPEWRPVEGQLWELLSLAGSDKDVSQISEQAITPATGTIAICPPRMSAFVSASEFCAWPLLRKISAQLSTGETLQLGPVPDNLSVPYKQP